MWWTIKHRLFGDRVSKELTKTYEYFAHEDAKYLGEGLCRWIHTIGRDGWVLEVNISENQLLGFGSVRRGDIERHWRDEVPSQKAFLAVKAKIPGKKRFVSPVGSSAMMQNKGETR